MPMVAAVIGAVAAVAGTVKQAQARRKAERAQRRQQTVQTRASRRQAIRKFVIARSQALASAQGAGSANSSGAMGGIGSLTSQFGTQAGLASQLSGLSQDISKATSEANRWGDIAQIGGMLYNYGSNYSGSSSSSSSS